MKKFTKVLSLLLAAILVLGCFAGCGTTGDDQKTPGEATGKAMPAIAKEDLKIGVIHIGNPADGAGYSYAHDKGIVAMQKELGLADSQIVRQNNVADYETAASDKAIETLLDAGCNVIFGTSWGYMTSMKKYAEEYPEVIFSHCSGNTNNGKNMNNYFGKIYQARYLAGIAAGLKTESDKIGYVAAMPVENAEVTGGIDAFALGVKSVNPEAKVYVKVTNTWFDLNLEKTAAVSLLDMGCDVIAQHQDTAQPQLAAQERGKWGVGYNSDMAKEAPDAVLTSVIWNWGVYYTAAVKDIVAGTWKCENYFDGMKEGLVDVTPATANCAPGTAEKIAEAKDKIVSGELEVFAGPIKDNADNEKVAAGDVLSDQIIAKELNWYVDNVVVAE